MGKFEIVLWTTTSDKPNRFFADEFFVPSFPGESFFTFTTDNEQFFVNKAFVISLTAKEVSNG